MLNRDTMPTEHAGEHVEGGVRQREEESRKNSNFGMFHADPNTSQTRLHENHGTDRNK